MKRITIISTSFLFLIVFFINNVYADMTFPAVAHQFMVSIVMPSYWSVVMALAILVVETFFIKKLLSLNLPLSFILSFIINLISSVAGVFLTSIPVYGRNIFSYGNMRFGTYSGMMPGYILTVIIEGLLLLLIALIIKRKARFIECMKTSAIMNFFSYLILLIGIFIVDILTKGQNLKTY